MAGVLEVNKLIVEGSGDKVFVNKLIEILNIENLEISEPLCTIDECICLDGLGNLEKKLKDIKLDGLDKLGILIDADEVGIQTRISEINKILKKLNIDIVFENINELKKDEKKDIEIACHILNIKDKGSLDNILKTIAKNSSPYADCLESWKKCLEEKEEKVSDPIFTKFWVNNYLRFDTCTKEEQKQISEKCNFEKALEKDVWNFEHQALDSLKDFLKLFQ
jgi:sugar phosphate isomerase/epimerase